MLPAEKCDEPYRSCENETLKLVDTLWIRLLPADDTIWQESRAIFRSVLPDVSAALHVISRAAQNLNRLPVYFIALRCRTISLRNYPTAKRWVRLSSVQPPCPFYVS